MPVASLPDLELVCAPRSSLSTQKYKPKVGGTNFITVPLAQILMGTRPPCPPLVIYATAGPLYSGRAGTVITHVCVCLYGVCVSARYLVNAVMDVDSTWSAWARGDPLGVITFWC